jgi:hypothetical protein
MCDKRSLNRDSLRKQQRAHVVMRRGEAGGGGGRRARVREPSPHMLIQHGEEPPSILVQFLN